MKVLLLLFLTCLLLGSCKKFIEVDPPVTGISAATLYTSDATAIAVMTAVYAKLGDGSSGPLYNFYGAFSGLPGLCSDELTLYDMSNNDLNGLYYDNYVSINGLTSSLWKDAYQKIYVVNAALEGLENATALTPAVRQQLQGEAKFIRALCYFQLVNLYGGVPLALTGDYKVNSVLSRSTKEAVWQQLTSDLRSAQTLLNKNYQDATLLAGTTERVRPTYWSATALLARALLYQQEWSGADSAATEVIDNTALYRLAGLDSAFLKNNSEAIWQIQPVDLGVTDNTGEGKIFVLPSAGPGETSPVYLSNAVYNSFESGDLRKTHWVGTVTVRGVDYRYPYKYKVSSVDSPSEEYSTFFRLGEQYLIRAEARAELTQLPEAAADLDVIRHRAGLTDITVSDQTTLLKAVQQERRVELFTEGHRWYDLARTGAIDSVMTAACQQKGGAWTPYRVLWPLPLTDLTENPSLKGAQNPGYQ